MGGKSALRHVADGERCSPRHGQRRPELIAKLSGAVLVALFAGLLPLGCSSKDRTECGCTAGDERLSVVLTEPADGSVEVCSGSDCASAPIEPFGSQGRALIAEAELGTWGRTHQGRLSVVVRDASGGRLSQDRRAAEQRDSCCGGYWTIDL